MRQRLQSADDGSPVSDNGSQASDDGSSASDDGSWASDNGLRAGAYVCVHMHPYASRAYKGGEVSLRRMALFLLFLIPNMFG